MEPVNLMTIGLPVLLQQIVSESFEKSGPLNLLGHYSHIADVNTQLSSQGKALIFVEANHSSVCPEVIYLYPHADVVAIDNSGKHIIAWSLVPKKMVLGEISSDELAEVYHSSGPFWREDVSS